MLSTTKNHYFLVLTPTAFLQLAYYSHESVLAEGSRVFISWGRKQLIGLIISEIKAPIDVKPEKIKAIDGTLDQGFKTQQLFKQWYQLIEWATDYYHVPPGEVFASAVPKRFLQDKKWLEPKWGNGSKDSLDNSQAPVLTQEQQQAVNDIRDTTAVHLLVGATSSGKTEVYIQLAADKLYRGEKVLILVPEIGLIPQTWQRFQQRFSLPVLQYHSAMTDRQRMQVWVNVMEQEPLVIIGTRSAIFLPIDNLSLIIIDEEHDLSLRQQDGFYYHARDLAIVKSQQQSISLVMGTATPAMESIYNARQGKYQLHQLTQRISQKPLPDWHLIDLKNEVQQAGLSEKLIDLIGATLARGEQVMIFLNRRGFAPTLRCNDCNETVQCTFCSVNLTIHSNPSRYMQCHQCGVVSDIPKQCETCNNKQFHFIGSGTERIEERLKQLFNKVPIHRIDSDSTKRKGTLEAILDKIKQGGPCIALGTQMISKGHHLPNMSVVAIIDIDSLLFSSDFRSIERLAQLMVQVSGRVGRGHTPGIAVLQSNYIDNPWLQAIINDGYQQVTSQLLEQRQQANLPPYQYMATLHSSGMSIDYPFEILQQCRSQFEQISKQLSIHLIGPMPAMIERRNNRYRYQLQVTANKRSDLHQWIDSITPWMNKQSRKKSWRWAIEVDPQSFD